MFYKFCLMMMCSVLLASCAHKTHAPQPVLSVSDAPAIQHHEVGTFTRVNARGAFDLTLHTGASRPKVILKGDPRDLAYVSTKVTHGVLEVRIGNGYPRFSKVQVDVFLGHLHGLEYHGLGRVSGTGIKTRLMDAVIDAQGPVKLKGQIGLRRLELDGSGYTEISGINSPNLHLILKGKPTVRLIGEVQLASVEMNNAGHLSLFWVKGRELTIRGRGKSWIQLAGRVQKLNVELWGKSRFNGRYLRADRAFVKTHDRSIAEMSAVLRQHTLALDQSDIYFYNIPSMKADFMGNAGAVLDMRNLSPPFVQEYSQYNK